MTRDQFGKLRVERDADEIRKITAGYEGPNATSFGFIGLDSGHRAFFASGRTDLLGMFVAEGIVKVVLSSDLTEAFIDAIAITAKQLLSQNEKAQ